MGEFWRLTPRELTLTFEAVAWRYEHEQRQQAWLAWHMAALTRAKRLPSLRRLMGIPASKRLSKDEAKRRTREHAELVERMRGKHGKRG